MTVFTWHVGPAAWMYPTIADAVAVVPGPTPPDDVYRLVVWEASVTESVEIDDGRRIILFPASLYFTGKNIPWAVGTPLSTSGWALRIADDSVVGLLGFDFIAWHTHSSGHIDTPNDLVERGRVIQVLGAELHMSLCSDQSASTEPVNMLTVEQPGSVVVIEQHSSFGAFVNVIAAQEGLVVVTQSVFGGGSDVGVRGQFTSSLVVGNSVFFLLSGEGVRRESTVAWDSRSSIPLSAGLNAFENIFAGCSAGISIVESPSDLPTGLALSCLVSRNLMLGYSPTYEVVAGGSPPPTTGLYYDVISTEAASPRPQCQIWNNVFRTLGIGVNVVFAAGSDVMAFHNTFVWPRDSSVLFNGQATGAAVWLVNNLFQGGEIPLLESPTGGAFADRGAVHFQSPVSHPWAGYTIQSNLFSQHRIDRRIYAAAATDLWGVYPGSNLTGDAVLLDLGPPLSPSLWDFRPGVGPAQSAAGSFPSVPVAPDDFSGVPRSSPADIGAFEG